MSKNLEELKSLNNACLQCKECGEEMGFKSNDYTSDSHFTRNGLYGRYYYCLSCKTEVYIFDSELSEMKKGCFTIFEESD